jgi:NADH:ubiquinone oxidoreductase subunit K
MEMPVTYFLGLSALMFVIGILGVLAEGAMPWSFLCPSN